MRLISRQVCAIVVTHNPGEGFAERIERFLAEFPAVYVIDNASHDLSLNATPALTVRRNQANEGIAKALNQGFSDALADGYEWAITLDQDSEPAPHFLAAMLMQAESLGLPPFLLGANFWDVHRKRLACPIPSERIDPVPQTTLITSGMMLPTRFALEIGGYDEAYFIDSVDHEFCLRAARHGAQVAITATELMAHTIGCSARAAGWVRALATSHPPWRKYYMARNTLWTIRKHGRFRPLWAARQCGRLCAEAVGLLIMTGPRFQRFGAFVAGVRDGLFRRWA